MRVGLILWAVIHLSQAQRVEFALNTKQVPAASFAPSVSVRQSHLLAALLLAPNRSRTLYTIPLFFSERRLRVEVAVDTGSAVLWLHRNQCVENTKQFCGKSVGRMAYSYLDGRLSGENVLMDVFLGPEPDSPVNSDCHVLLASQRDPGVSEPILGLGIALGVRGPTFLEQLVTNKVISAPVFTFDLPGGRFFFGESVKKEKRLMIDYEPRTNYAFKIRGISFNGVLIHRRKSPAILDSGNTLIALPIALLSQVINAAKVSKTKCEARPEENPLFVELWCSKPRESFSGLAFRISRQRISFGSDNFFFGKCQIGAKLCRTVLEFHSHTSLGAIIGQPLFRQFIVTFDQLRRRIYLSRQSSLALDAGIDEALD